MAADTRLFGKHLYAHLTQDPKPTLLPLVIIYLAEYTGWASLEVREQRICVRSEVFAFDLLAFSKRRPARAEGG